MEVTETATSPQHMLTEAAANGDSKIGEFTFWRSNSGISEIEEVDVEEEDANELFEISRAMTPIKEDVEGSLFSFDVNGGEDNVYVAVGKDEASVDALAWALRHAVVDTATFVYLIHVFPVLRYIPTPLGNLPKSQVSPGQVKNYMAQERGKRRELLQKFISICSDYKVTDIRLKNMFEMNIRRVMSGQSTMYGWVPSLHGYVKVDTMLIESDTVGKAIQELIPVLNIRKLVLGTSRSYSRKSKSRRSGSGIADQILQHAPEYCDVKVISEGKEVDTQMIDLASLRSSSTPRSKVSSDGDEPNALFSDGQRGGEYPKAGSVTCGCFKL